MHETTWWFWMAWIEDPGPGTRPLYAFAARTLASTAKVERVEIALPSGAKLVKLEARVATSAANGWFQTQLAPGVTHVDLQELLGPAPPIPVAPPRRLWSTAFGQSPVAIVHYSGSLTYAVLVTEFPDAHQAIKYLRDELGLAFDKSYAAHLGGFDLMEMESPFDAPCEFDVKIMRTATPMLRLTRIDVAPDATVVVRTLSMGEPNLCSLLPWPSGTSFLDVPVDRETEKVEVEVYTTGTGRLIYAHDCGYIMEVEVNIGLGGRALHLQDALVRRAESLGQRARQRAERATSVQSQLSRVGGSDVRLRVHGLRRAVKQLTDWTLDRWFDRGVGGELDVIDHLNSLLNDPEVTHAILADPFFGEEAFRRFALRLQNSDLKLTVVTSWGRTDPDTAKVIADGVAQSQRRLEALLDAVAPVVASKLEVLNIIVGNGEQAFHDRYLAIYRRDGECWIWLLSNSINAMAMNWPFAMSQLTGNTAWQAQRYLEGLTRGHDCQSTKTFTVTFQWPAQATPVAN